MTDVDYERVAREFLAWALDYEDGHWRDSQRRSTIDPSPSWSFFGACWEEVSRRSWIWCWKDAPGVVDAADGWTVWTDDVDGEFWSGDADPRVALPACIIQWLDAHGETHD